MGDKKKKQTKCTKPLDLNARITSAYSTQGISTRDIAIAVVAFAILYMAITSLYEIDAFASNMPEKQNEAIRQERLYAHPSDT